MICPRLPFVLFETYFRTIFGTDLGRTLSENRLIMIDCNFFYWVMHSGFYKGLCSHVGGVGEGGHCNCEWSV